MKRTHYEIKTTDGVVSFYGKHLPERERPNWHYYETQAGVIYHFRKEQMIFVREETGDDED